MRALFVACAAAAALVVRASHLIRLTQQGGCPDPNNPSASVTALVQFPEGCLTDGVGGSNGVLCAPDGASYQLQTYPAPFCQGVPTLSDPTPLASCSREAGSNYFAAEFCKAGSYTAPSAAIVERR